MGEENKKRLEQQLWNIANELRGKMDADEFRDYILGFIFYKYLSEKIEDYAHKNKKKILFVLSYPGKTIAPYIEKNTRFDQSFIDYLKTKNLPYIDLMEIHTQDFKKYNLNIKNYINNYFIGHYNPTGNFFCAFALKDKLVELLDPKPFPYRNE